MAYGAFQVVKGAEEGNVRIVMVSSSFLKHPIPVGGEPRHVKSVTNMLIARGHKVALTIDDQHLSSASMPGLDATFSPTLLFPRLVNKAFPIDLAVYIAFWRFLRSWRPDIVHLHACLDFSLVPIIVAARAGVPVVVTVHSSWPVCFRHGLCYNEDGSCVERFSRRICSACLAYGRRIENKRRVPIAVMSVILLGAWWARRRVFRHVGRFIVPSAIVGRRIRDAGISTEQISAIPYDLPTDDFSVRSWVARPGGEGVRLLCVGRLEPGKGVQYLLHALREVCAVHPDLNLTLTVVGDGSFRPELEQLTASLDLRGAVRFIGAQLRSRLPDLYADTDLVVIPSLSEALPYVALEAGTIGVPVVATHVGGIPEIFGNDAIIVPPMDATALARGILAVLSDRDAANTRAARARERFRTNYGCDTMVNRIETVYAELRDSKTQIAHRPRSDSEAAFTRSVDPKRHR